MWKFFLAHEQNNGHQQRGEAKAQKQHGECIEAVCVKEAPEDGKRPKRRGRDGDKQNPCKLFHVYPISMEFCLL